MLLKSDEPSLRMRVVNLETGAVSMEQVPLSRISPRSTSVSKLTRSQIKRIKRIYRQVGYVVNKTVNDWINGFTYDIHPEQEIQFWEKINTVFEKFNNRYQLTASQKKEIVFKLIKLVEGEKLEDDISRKLVELLLEEQPLKSSTQQEKQLAFQKNINYRMFSRVYQEYVRRYRLEYHDDIDRVLVALIRLMEGNKPEGEFGKELLEIWKHLEEEESEGKISQDFNPDDIKDERQWSASGHVCRPGQKKFKRQLLEAYDRRCSITGCDEETVLEAAHIIGYRGSKSDHPSNGLLLRSDIHTLFDAYKLSINPKTNRVEIAPSLKNTKDYKQLAGQPLKMPKNQTFRPNIRAIEMHYKTFQAINRLASE